MKHEALSPGSQILDLDQRFRAPLMAYFLRRTRNRRDAEDLTQDAFTRLLGSSSTFETNAQAYSYVFRVAANLLADRGRRQMVREASVGGQFDTTGPISGQVVEERSPERVLIGQENLQELYAVLEGLDLRTRNVFILYRIEGMKQKDIAILLGIGLSTVEKHCMLAMTTLASHFPGATP